MAKLKLVKPLTDYSFEIKTEDDLLNAFSVKDRKKLIMPSKFVFPLRTKHYFTWTSPDGFYVYLVFKNPQWKSPRGAVFRGRHTQRGLSSAMCDWCHSYGSSDEIGMLLTTLTPKKSIGIMLCLDLGCIDKTETLAMLSGRDFDRMADKVCGHMNEFFEALKNNE